MTGLPTDSPEVLIGRNVKTHREAEELTQVELAELLRERGWDIDATAITRIEKGQRSIRVSQLYILADALSSSVEDLLYDEQARIADRRWNVHRHLRSARHWLAKGIEDALYVRNATLHSPEMLSNTGLPGVTPEEYLAYVRDDIKRLIAEEDLPVAVAVRGIDDSPVVILQEIADAIASDIIELADNPYDPKVQAKRAEREGDHPARKMTIG